MSDSTTSGASSVLDDNDVSISDLAKHIRSLTDRVDDLEAEVAEKDKRIDELEQRVDAREDKAAKAKAHRKALARKTQSCGECIDELQAREFEKGAHLLADNVDKERITVDGNKLERITKDDGNTYFRLPGEEDALGRGGAVAHSTADLLPIQRLSRYDDEMLASVTNRKPDELAGKVWRERDEAGRYSLWSTGSGEIRAYLDASELADWIRLKESGVSKKYSQELARRTMDAMHELSNGRLGKIKRQRSKDGLSYQETRLVLKSDVELPGEVNSKTTDDSPTTDGVAGE
ncbi:hypothetical protein [Haladaptatus sp. DYF46]|uniref:hypothetical protein n=1 Tax=Haladaptatus sp. DYF46 TaxID=2886041 RepID=UPI001E63289E|nr:hypothetical protein [Haladaptatus sp. DYF46]